MRTYICDSGSGVAAVTIAVDRETADASRGLKWLRETVTYTCVPYVYNWSQDVEKCTLDLVLSSSTRTNTVQATAMASKERRKSLRHPLTVRVQARQSFHTSWRCFQSAFTLNCKRADIFSYYLPLLRG